MKCVEIVKSEAIKIYVKYSFISGLISGVGSQIVVRKNCVQQLHVKYCLAVPQRMSVLVLCFLRVSQCASCCHSCRFSI